MKKILSGIVMVITTLSIGTSAFAVGPGMGQNFVDVDGNGICDNIGLSCRYTNAENSGICNIYNTGMPCGYGKNFVDADGDGICDHFAGSCLRDGVRQGNGFRGGRNNR